MADVGEEKGDKDWSAIVRNFTQETTFHGVKYIAADTRYRSRRISWVFIVLGVIVTFTYALVTSVLHYYEYPSNIELEVGYLEEVPFPAIAICNENPYRLTASHKAGIYDVITQTYDRIQNTVDSDEDADDHYMINRAGCNLTTTDAVFELKIGDTSVSVCKSLCSHYKHRECSGFLFDFNESSCLLTSSTGNEDDVLTKTEVSELQKECADKKIFFYRRIRPMGDHPIYCNFEHENVNDCSFIGDTKRTKNWFIVEAVDIDVTFGSDKGHYLFVHDITEFLPSSAEIHTQHINTTGKCLFAFAKIMGYGSMSLKVSAISETLTDTTMVFINNSETDHQQNVWRHIFTPLPDGVNLISIEALIGAMSDGEFFLDEITVDSCASMTNGDSCIKSAVGSEYVGDLSTNIHGEKCVVWKEVISYHNWTLPLDVYIPDSSWEDAYNYCRFVFGISTNTPGCFNENLEYADCEIQRCSCGKGEFMCETSRVCIPTETTCDYENNCEDMSDERQICDSKHSLACDFSDPYICGYKQENIVDQLLWLPEFDTSTLSFYLQLIAQDYVVPGSVVRLVSPPVSLDSNTELSITFKPFYASDNNAIHVWFRGDFGHSNVPVITHNSNSLSEDVEEHGLFQMEQDGVWIRYKTCMPETQDMMALSIVIETVYNSVDEDGFQIGEIELDYSTNCVLPDGYQNTVFARSATAGCSFDADLCSFTEYSDHTNLTWTLLPKDTVATAMHVFNETVFINTDCNLCISFGDTSYDFIYFENTGTIQSTNYPDNYPNYANNRWLIHGSYGVRVYIEFIIVGIEEHYQCDYDQLTIKDLSTGDNETHCGILIPPPYLSAGHLVEIAFTSDFVIAGPGFQLNYTILAEGHIDNVAVLSYTAPYYTEGILYAYFFLSLTQITDQGCISFEYINLATFTVAITDKRLHSKEVFIGSDTNFPQWRKVYLDYSNNENNSQGLVFSTQVDGVYGRQLAMALNDLKLVNMSCSELQQTDVGSDLDINCSFATSDLCGYTQSSNHHYSWISSFPHGKQESDISRSVLKLIHIEPSIERERYWIASNRVTLTSNQIVSVNIQALANPEVNLLMMWLMGHYGHSSKPIALYGSTEHLSNAPGPEFPLLMDVTTGASSIQYDLCLPAGEVTLVFDAVYEKLDEFVINNITTTGDSCDINSGELATVFPVHGVSTCSSDMSAICLSHGLSDHEDLNWLNIAKDDVIKAMSLSYDQIEDSSEYKTYYDGQTHYDDVYFALNSTIQSPVYTSTQQTQFHWLVRTPDNTRIDVTFHYCNFHFSCIYKLTFQAYKVEEMMCKSCYDYSFKANEVNILYEREDPGDSQYGFLLQYEAVPAQTDSARILHYSGQMTSHSYASKLVTPLIESNSEQCLSFAYVSQTSLTVNLVYGNGSYSNILNYTAIPYPLLWINFTRTIAEEVGLTFYIEFVGEKSEAYNKRDLVAVASLQITENACEEAETDIPDEMNCSFDDLHWCGYKEHDDKEYPGWISGYQNDRYTDLSLYLSAKGHETIPGMISYLWSPSENFETPTSVTISFSGTQKLSLWLHGSYGLSRTPIEDTIQVLQVEGKSSSDYIVCIPAFPGGKQVTQQVILMAEYTAEKDIIVEKVEGNGRPCIWFPATIFDIQIILGSSITLINSYQFMPDNKYFSWTWIPKSNIDEARQIQTRDGQLVYDGDTYTDIFLTLNGELLLSSLDVLALKWLIIMPEGIGVELHFEYINIGEFGNPCEDIFLKLTDGQESNTKEYCGVNQASILYTTTESKVWISLEEYIEPEEETSVFSNILIEDSIYVAKSVLPDMERIQEPKDGFELTFKPLGDLKDIKETVAVLYKGAPTEIEQWVRLISPSIEGQADHCLTFSYQSFYQLAVAILWQNGSQTRLFNDRSQTSTFWKQAVISVMNSGNQSMSLMFKAANKPGTNDAYFVFFNNVYLHPQRCDLILFDDSSVNCTFTDSSCGYIDMSGNPRSKWLRDLSNKTDSSDLVGHFVSHHMTTESSPFLSPLFTLYEDSCLSFRVFQIHKTCLIITFYTEDSETIERLDIDCKYTDIGSWADVNVNMMSNVSRFSFSVAPNKGRVQELYIDDIVVLPNTCPKNGGLNHDKENMKKPARSDLVDITTTYISEDEMYDVLVQSLDMSWQSVLQDVSHSFSGSLLSCYWNGQECEDYMINQTVTDMGMCISFNTHHKTLSSGSSGSQHGLKLTLNTETYEHIAGISSDSGFKVQFYDHHEIPIMERKGQVVSPGIHAMFTLNYAESKFLEPEYGTCGSVELEEYPGVNYTTSHCLTQCDTKSTETHCQCRLPYMPGSTDATKQCTLQTYLQCVLTESQNASKTKDKCTCPDSCDKVLYEGQMSYSTLSGLALKTIIGNKQAQVQKDYMEALEIDQRLDKDVFLSILTAMSNVLESIERLELFVQVETNALKALLSNGLDRMKDIVINDIIMSMNEIVEANEVYETHIKKERMNLVTVYKDLPDTIWGFVHYVKWNHYPESFGNSKELLVQLADLTTDAEFTLNNFDKYIYMYGANLNDTVCTQQAYDLSKFPFCPETLHVGVDETYFPSKAVLDEDLYTTCKTMADSFHIQIESFKDDYPDNFYVSSRDGFPTSYTNYIEVLNISVDYANSITEIVDNLTQCLTEYGTFLEDVMFWRTKAWNPTTWNTDTQFITISDLQAIKLHIENNLDWYADAWITKYEMAVSAISGNRINPMTSPDYISKWINTFSDEFDQYVTDMRSLFDEINDEYSVVYRDIVKNYMDFIEYIGAGTNDTNIRGLRIFRNPRPNVLGSQVMYLYTEDQVAGLTSGDIFNFLNKSSASHLRDNLAGYFEDLDYLLVEYKTTKDTVKDSLVSAAVALQETAQQYLDSTELQPAFVQENILQVDVYYAELKYSRTEQKVAYGVGDFFSDLGGFLGLLLGASIITVFEVLDLLIYNIIESKAFKNKVSPKEDSEERQIDKDHNKTLPQTGKPIVVKPYVESI